MRAPESPAQLAAFILAGGKSSRMGEDKAFLKLDGQTLLDIAVNNAHEAATTVNVVGARNKFGNAAIEDVFRNCGPLGGIHAALTWSSAELNLIMAVDLPLMEARFLRFLGEQARASGAVVTVPRTNDGFQPLCAVYRKNFRDIAEKALKQKGYKIDALFPLVELRVIDEEEMRRFAFNLAMFQNLNTPEDYQHARGTTPT